MRAVTLRRYWCFLRASPARGCGAPLRPRAIRTLALACRRSTQAQRAALGSVGEVCPSSKGANNRPACGFLLVTDRSKQRAPRWSRGAFLALPPPKATLLRVVRPPKARLPSSLPSLRRPLNHLLNTGKSNGWGRSPQSPGSRNPTALICPGRKTCRFALSSRCDTDVRQGSVATLHDGGRRVGGEDPFTGSATGTGFSFDRPSSPVEGVLGGAWSHVGLQRCGRTGSARV